MFNSAMKLNPVVQSNNIAFCSFIEIFLQWFWLLYINIDAMNQRDNKKLLSILNLCQIKYTFCTTFYNLKGQYRQD